MLTRQMLKASWGEPDLVITCAHQLYVNSVCTVKLYDNVDTAIIYTAIMVMFDLIFGRLLDATCTPVPLAIYRK